MECNALDLRVWNAPNAQCSGQQTTNHRPPKPPTHAARARLLPALEALELEEAEDEELNGQQRRNVEPVVLQAGEVPARPFRRSSVSDWSVGWPFSASTGSAREQPDSQMEPRASCRCS